MGPLGFESAPISKGTSGVLSQSGLPAPHQQTKRHPKHEERWYFHRLSALSGRLPRRYFQNPDPFLPTGHVHLVVGTHTGAAAASSLRTQAQQLVDAVAVFKLAGTKA